MKRQIIDIIKDRTPLRPFTRYNNWVFSTQPADNDDMGG